VDIHQKLHYVCKDVATTWNKHQPEKTKTHHVKKGGGVLIAVNNKFPSTRLNTATLSDSAPSIDIQYELASQLMVPLWQY
jgi:hypothetical protein